MGTVVPAFFDISQALARVLIPLSQSEYVMLIKWLLEEEQLSSLNLSGSTTFTVSFHNSFSSSLLTPLLLDYQQNREFWHR